MCRRIESKLLCAKVMLLLWSAVAGASATGTVLYVDDDAPPGGDGLGWPSAYRYLQDALFHAREVGDVAEIRVGQGSYRPDLGGDVVQGDRGATFSLSPGLALRGGFAGFGAPDPDDRDPVSYVTVLTGDLLGDDEPGFMNVDDNTHHVVSAVMLGNVRLDGCTISGGNAEFGPDDSGGGVQATQTDVVVFECTFRSNRAEFGGGIASTDGALDFTDCVFEDNSAEVGGAVHCEGYAILRRCRVANNFAECGGGGVKVRGAACVVESIFEGNDGEEYGAAGLDVEGSAIVRNSHFVENKTGEGRGGGALLAGGESLVTDCVFTRNRALNGGGLVVAGEQSLVERCLFLENQAVRVPGARGEQSSSNPSQRGGGLLASVVTVRDSVFCRNEAFRGGGVATGGVAHLEDCTFEQNTAIWGGAAWNRWAEITIDRCGFRGNSAERGGVLYALDPAVIRDSVFSENTAELGGVVYSRQPATISACDLRDNVAELGGVVYASGGTITCVESTLSLNVAEQGGVAYVRGNANLVLRDCVVDRNEAGAGGAVFIAEGALVSIEGTRIDGGHAVLGGAIYMLDGEIALNASEIVSNEAMFGGAVYVEGGSWSAEGSRFEANQASRDGGMLFEFRSTDLVFDSCTLKANSALGDGGGLYAIGDSLRLSGCELRGNEAENGGGAFMLLGGGVIEATTFAENLAERGAGAYFVEGGGILSECAFVGNVAEDEGAGVYLDGHGGDFDRCVFEGNQAYRGGGVYVHDGGPALHDCTFRTNVADQGGGMYTASGELLIVGCTFEDNVVDGEGGAIAGSAGSQTIIDCRFAGNGASLGGAAFLEGVESSFSGCEFHANEGRDGGALALCAGRATLRGCVFAENRAERCGGAVRASSAAEMVVSDTVFRDNEAGEDGGGIAYEGDAMTVTGSTFRGNGADCGGAIYSSRPGASVVSSLFVNNAALRGRAVCSEHQATTVLANCTIMHHQGAGTIATRFGGVASVQNCVATQNGEFPFIGSIAVSYSNVEGGWDGPGNIETDPLFVDPIGPDGIPGTPDDDYRLAPGSPCIDAGDNDGVPEGITDDLDGLSRFVDDPATTDTGHGEPPLTDMGAYEFQACAADLDHDGLVGFSDLIEVLTSWGPCPPDRPCTADLNADGDVGVGDLITLLVNWGSCDGG